MLLSNIENLLMNPCGMGLKFGSDILSIDDETDEHTLESKDTFESQEPLVLRELMPESPARSTNSAKSVRFAVDDEPSIRKRRQRNLRKRIVQKSRSSSNSSSSIRTESSPRRNIPLSPTAPSRRAISSSPRSPARSQGRRRKIGQMAASLGAPHQC